MSNLKTSQERILGLLAEGLELNEIAQKTELSRRSVEFLIAGINKARADKSKIKAKPYS